MRDKCECGHMSWAAAFESVGLAFLLLIFFCLTIGTPDILDGIIKWVNR
jgi:hypothetical protein